jgi:hypothetical protein
MAVKPYVADVGLDEGGAHSFGRPCLNLFLMILDLDEPEAIIIRSERCDLRLLDMDAEYARGQLFEDAGVQTPSPYLCGLLGCLLFEAFLPLFALLLVLSLLIVNTLDKGVDRVVQGPARRQGATFEHVGVGVTIHLRRNACQQQALHVGHSEEVTRVRGTRGGCSGPSGLERLCLGCRIGSLRAQ